MGKKSDDRWVVPLCRSCHNGVHTVGSKHELEWFLKLGIDSERLASELWTAGTLELMKAVVIEYMTMSNWPGSE